MTHRPEIEDVYRLLPLQEGMLFETLRRPGSGVYVVQLACRLEGRLEPVALERAWGETVAAHPVLRTSFHWEGMEHPHQVVHRRVDPAFRMDDWRGVEPGEEDRRFRALLAEDRRWGFDLSQPPLGRLLLLDLGAGRWRLLWTQHHLILDGWSQPLVLRELFERYRAAVTGRTPTLPAAPPFRRVVERFVRRDRQAVEAFWRRQLGGLDEAAPPRLPEPAAAPDGADGVGRFTRSLSPEETAALSAFARREGLTPGTVVQGAWSLALSRWTGVRGGREVVFGVVVSGRPADLPGVERMVGPLIDTVPLRVPVPRDADGVDWLRSVRDRLTAVEEQGPVPLAEVPGWAGLPRDRPLFESLVAFENYPLDPSLAAGVEGVTIQDVRSHEQDSVPLALAAMPGAGEGGGLELQLSYHRSRFESAAVRRLLAQVAAAVGGLVAAGPGVRRLVQVPTLPAAERHRMLVEWGDGGAALAPRASVPETFRERAAAAPDAPALHQEGAGGARSAWITYGELARRVARLAAELRSAGAGPEVPVAVLPGSPVEAVTAFLAILEAGAVYVPLEAEHPPERLSWTLRWTAERAFPEAPVSLLLAGREAAAPLELPRGMRRIEPSGAASEGRPAAELPPVAPVPPEAAGHLIYTSGSTGEPHGVAVSRAGLAEHVAAIRRLYPLGPDDRVLQAHSLAFDASVAQILAPLTAGACLLPRRGAAWSAPELFDRVARWRLTVVHLPTAYWREVGREVGEDRPLDLPAVRLLLAGGESMSPTAAGRWRRGLPGARLINSYGPTEAVVTATLGPVDETPDPRRGSVPIGRPLPGRRALVLDRWGRPMPEGAEGELCLAGVLARGYAGRPASTAERFVPDPFAGQPGGRLHRTGDRTRWVPGARLQVLGRLDSQVKVRGFRVEPAEAEVALAALPGVAEAVVLPRTVDGVTELLAFAEAAPDGTSASSLRASLARTLPAYLVPARIRVVPAFPRAPTGKVDRRALVERWGATASPPVPGAGGEAPRTPLEAEVAAVWAGVLGLSEVGRTDSFFDLGGHSLLAMQVVSRLRRRFDVDLPLGDLFEHATVAALSRRLEARLGTAREAQPPLRSRPRRSGEPLPASAGQERLWFLDRLDPGSAAYAVPLAVRVRGRLDRKALARALAGVVERHESLRTTFAERGGRPVQVIAPAAAAAGPAQLARVDLSRLPEPARSREAASVADSEAARPFDLARGPLLRPRLLALGGDDHLLLLNAHHAVTDEWSMPILVRELAALYRGEALDPLPVQYADWALWQREWAGTDGFAGDLAWWRQRLAGAPEAVDLPADRPRPAAPTDRGGRVPVRLGREAADGLRQAARAGETTLFTVLLAGVQAWLRRLGAGDDLVVGSPVANRTHPETEGLVGFFINTVAVRTILAGDPPFSDLLARVRRDALDALARQAVPYERVVEAVAPERTLGRTPLLQVMLAFHTVPLPELDLGGLVLEPVAVGGRTAKLDLLLELTDGGAAGARGVDGEVAGTLEYSADLFDRATAERLAGHLVRLLEGAARDAELRLSELPLLSPAELRQVTAEWSGPERRFPVSPTLPERFAAHAAAAPDAVAVAVEDAAVTYGELRRRAAALAGRLRSLDVGLESRVGLLADRSVELVVGVLGILEAGGAYVPLDPRYPEDHRSHVLDDAGVEVVVGGPESDAGLGDRVWVPVPGAAEPGTPPAPRPLAPESLAYVLYTSGSTGRPKGVLVSHGAAARLLRATGGFFAPSRDDAWTLFHSPAFDFSVWELWGPLAHGGRLEVVPYWASRSPGELRDLLAERRITVLSQTPSAFRSLAAAAPGPHALPDLRWIVFGGERLEPAALAGWLGPGAGARAANLYGITETTVHTTFREMDSEDLAAPWRSPVGRPLPDLAVYLADPGGRPVAAGVPGELLVGGDGLARGYLGRPGLTAERFVPDPYSGRPGARLYRSGDLARWLPSGELEYRGRLDQQVKVRGFRIEPGEVEAALEALEPVARAVVTARDDLPGGGGLVAYVVPAAAPAPEAAPEPSPPALRAALERVLPPHMVPVRFVALPELPTTPSGKVDRRALPAPEGGPGSGRPYQPPRSELERALAGIWAEVLELDRVGVDESFFDLGGHSLLATRVVSRVRDVLGVEVPLRELFARPTVAALAESVGRLAPPRGAAVPVRADREDRPVSPAQERLWFLDRFAPGTAALHVPVTLRLAGDLDAAALARALREVARRHEVLRSSYPEVDGRPVQKVRPPAPVPLPVVDLAGVPPEHGARTAERLAAEAARRPFRVAEGPLLRLVLLALGPRERVLHLTVHHLVADGWSLGVLVRELTAVYRARLEGVAPDLPELPVQYADYARWLRDRLEGGDLQGQVEHWRRRLEGAPPHLDLPIDRPRPPVQGGRGRRVGRTLPEGLSARLRTLARGAGASPFMVLLAALGLLLGRWSGQREVVVGSPVAGRTRRELEGLVGLFLNHLALRLDLSGSPTGDREAAGARGPAFRDLLDRARAVALDAFEHQEVPFERVLDALFEDGGHRRDLSRTPVFQVYLNVLNFPVERVSLPDLVVEPLPAADGTAGARFDLELYVGEPDGPDGRFDLDLAYDADLFDRWRGEELLEQLERLLAAVVARPEAPVAEVSLVTERALSVLPDPAAALSSSWEGPVHGRLERWARETPDRVALAWERGAVTYGRLDAAVEALAGRLNAAGVGRGDRVAIRARRVPALAAAVLGVLRSGAAFVVLDPAHPPARNALCLVRARPRAWLDLAPGDGVTEELAAALDELPDLRLRRVLPPLEGAGPWPGGAPSTAPHPRVGPDDAAYVAFTSGSTGEPKGVVGLHRSLSHFLPWQERELGLSAEDRFSLLSGLAHDPLHRDLFTPLWVGATIAVPDEDRLGEPGWLAAWAAAARVTVAHLTPALGRLLAEVPATQAASLPALRAALSVGDVLTGRAVADLCRLSPAARVVNLYGATETQRAVGWWEVTEGAGGPGTPDGAVPLGQELPDVQLLVLAPGGGLAGIGEVGEVHVRSPHLASGYLDDPRLTAVRFVPHGGSGGPGERCYRTGDLGRYRRDGAVEPRGRADRQTQVRGFRVEPGEVEAALERHPAVRDAAVVDRPGPDGRRLVAYLVPVRAGAPLPDTPELRRFVAARLPPYMVPAAFVGLDALPLTPNRKLDRAALPEPPEEPEGVGGASLAGDPTAEVVAGLWAEVLGVEGLGPGSDFFDLGGHSLQVTRVLARVRDALGVELPVRSLFESSTVAAFARRVEAARRSRGEAGGAAAPPPLAPAPRAPEAELPASFSQERLWLVHRLDPESPAYHLSRAVALRGRIDPAALARALDALLARHDALRTSLPERDDRPVQRVATRLRLPLPVLDLRAVPPELRDRVAGRILADLSRRPFDLATPPLLRAVLVRLGAADHRFGLVLHHAVADGWSMGLLVRDLAALYRQAAGAGPAGLPPLPVQYPDYAVWQRAWLREEVLEEELGWWRGRLDPAPEPLELPADRPRPERRSHRAHRVPLALPPEAAAAVRGLARRGGATPFMVLLAAFQAVLGRWSGSLRVAVGTAVANRRDPRLEGVVGFFVNTLVLVGDLEGDPPFRRHLARVRGESLGALAHQDLPFERLVEELRPARDRSRPPLFQAWLAFQNVPVPAAEPVPGLRVEPLPPGGEGAMVDLAALLSEGPAGGLDGSLTADADLFDAATAVRLAGHLAHLIEGAAATPERRLSELPLLGRAERHQVTLEWPGTPGGTGPWSAPPAPPELVLHGDFQARAAERPDGVAVVQGRAAWTYGALDARSRDLAGRLRQVLGAGAGEPRVGIAMDRSPEQVAALLGILAAGAAYVPLDPGLPAERVREIAARAGLAAAVVGSGGPPEGLPPLPVLTVGGRRRVPREELAPLPPVAAERLAYVLFTSGSTGAPKGVMVSHRSAAAFCRRSAVHRELRPGTRRLQVSPLSFDFSVSDLFPVLGVGGTVVLRPPGPFPSVHGLLELCRDQRVESMLLATPLWHELAAADADLPPSVRRVMFGGEAALAEHVARWRRRADPSVGLVNAYGPTEATVVVATAELAGAAKALTPAGEVPLGRPDPGHRIHLVDPEARPVPARVAGEVWIGGTGVARGYLEDPGRTAAVFVPDPFAGRPGERLYRAGDLGRRLPDGTLVYLGRIDRQVKVRGMRLEPGEVESALVALPGIREAAVGLLPGPGGVGVLVAWVAADDGPDPQVDRVREALEERLPSWAVPAAFVPVDRLPRTASGKVDRRALPPPAAEALGRGAGRRVAPRTELEREIAAVWEEVLEAGPVGITDDFFGLGGHSLLAVRLASRLEDRLGTPVPMAWLFEHPTVESLAAAVRRHAGPQPVPVLVRLRPPPAGGASRPPLVLVHPAGGTAYCYGELAEALEGGRAVWAFQAPGVEGEEEPLERVEDLAERYLDELAAAPEVLGEAAEVHLGGWSFGALVAFEMARRMSARGLAPGTVVAIDAAPGSIRAPEGSGERWEAELLSRALADAVPVLAEELLGLDAAGRVERVVARARERGLLPPGFDRGSAERLLRVFTANLRAARGYRPGRFLGRLVLVRAADGGHLPEEDPAAGWRDVVPGGVEVVEVPGNHRDVVHGANARALAQALDAILEARLTRPTTAAG